MIPIHLEGCTTGEVAKRLDITPGSIKLLTDYFVREIGELPSGAAA